MIKINVTLREGETRVIEGQAGESLMEAIRNAGIDELTAMCGGCRSCATCHVYVQGDLAATGDVSEDETDLLEVSDYRRDNSRLSCQIALGKELDGLVVTIAPEE